MEKLSNKANEQNGQFEMADLLNWKLILSPREIQICVKKCADKIIQKFSGKKEKIVVVCILKGAVYFFADLTKYLGMLNHSCYFIEASSYHNNQKQSNNLTVLSFIEASKFTDKHVILIDELFDSGKTIHQIKNTIMTEANIDDTKITTCTLFKKNKSTSYPPPDIYGIIVPDVWLVGYGLDDKQEKRNWTALFGCPKNNGIDETEDDAIFRDEKAYQNMTIELCNKLYS